MTQSMDPQETISVEITGNNSMSPQGAWLFYGSIFAFTVLISGGWALLGYWPVLPFAGLELSVLALALYLCRMRADYRELLIIAPSEVTLERGRLSRRQKTQWPRAWVRPELVAAPKPSQPSRLLLCSAGEHIEIASMLTDPERRSLHARLRELLAS
jgi:uncharacterized membrane protein